VVFLTRRRIPLAQGRQTLFVVGPQDCAPVFVNVYLRKRLNFGSFLGESICRMFICVTLNKEQIP
jgi:hypothetical protein